MKIHTIDISEQKLAEICRRFGVMEMAVFGSVLRDDFRTDSDIDVLITFALNRSVDSFDLAELQLTLESFFNRSVDVVEKAALVNPFRRKAILSTAEVIYAA
jgi:predicted nucleotidyltransferase